MSAVPVRSRAGRAMYGALGWISVGLAFTGVFVPGMPTTVFVLIASFFFARSSPRFEQWLRDNRWFGPRLRRYQETGGMPRSAKTAALTSMWVAIAFSCLVLIRIHFIWPLVTIAAGAAGTLAILFGVRTVPEER